MRIDRVVAERPEEAGDVQRERRRRQVAGDRGPADQRAPVEGQAQERLGPPGDPLHERVHDHQRQRCQAEQDGEAVEAEQDEQPDQKLQGEECQRLAGGQLAARQRPVARALDPGVEVAIGEVVDHAPGAAHRHRPDREQREQLEIRPSGRQRDRPPARPQQQPGADRPIPAGEDGKRPQPVRDAIDPGELAIGDARRAVQPLPHHADTSSLRAEPRQASRSMIRDDDPPAKIRLYVDLPLGSGGVLEPSPAQCHYLLTVMRRRAGETIALFNGRDGEWLARDRGLRASPLSVACRTPVAAAATGARPGVAVCAAEAVPAGTQASSRWRTGSEHLLELREAARRWVAGEVLDRGCRHVHDRDVADRGQRCAARPGARTGDPEPSPRPAPLPPGATATTTPTRPCRCRG